MKNKNNIISAGLIAFYKTVLMTKNAFDKLERCFNGIEKMIKENNKEFEYFECACGEYGHPLKLTYFPEDEVPAEIFLCISAKPYGGFWKRLLDAFRFILFDKNYDYGEFLIVDKKEVERMINFLSKLVDEKK